MFKRKLLINAILLTGLAGGFYSSAWAATTTVLETNPAGNDNDDCPSAQSFATPPAIALPIVLKGALDTNGGTDTDDYFEFQAEPGTQVTVTAKLPVSGIPVLLDANDRNALGNCENIAPSAPDTITFTVPDGGSFVVHAAGSDGAYQLSLTKVAEPPVPPAVVGSITSKVIDSITGKPVKGIHASLQSCIKRLPCEDIAGTDVWSDSKGVIEWTDNDFQLAPGNFKIAVNAKEPSYYYDSNYSSATTAKFAAAAEEEKDVSDIALEGKKVSISTKGCTVTGNGPLGSICRFSAVVTNKTAAALKAKVEGVLHGYNLYEEDDMATVKTTPAYTISLKAGAKSNTLSFQFFPPKDVIDGAYICPSVEVSDGAKSFGQKILASAWAFPCITYNEGFGWSSN